MRTILVVAVVLALLGLATTGQLRAENDQAGVLGFGLGVHTFSDSDGFRNSNINVSEMDTGGMLQIFGEWYILGDVGIGFRLIGIGAEERATTNADGSPLVFANADRIIESQTLMFTWHWVVAGSESYVRVGLLAGVGPARYTERLEADCPLCPNSAKIIVSEKSATGTATLFSAYFDWGGDVFGARIGASVLRTDLDTIEGIEADASGVSLYFDFRWAFTRG